jgi:protein-S-isoprenylcysteine O-methyltransferase Ste14
MYTAGLLMFPSQALMLGSWWGLVIAGFLAILFVGRTAFEDRLLRRALGGYAEYASRVRYRLIPGVW